MITIKVDMDLMVNPYINVLSMVADYGSLWSKTDPDQDSCAIHKIIIKQGLTVHTLQIATF